MLARWLLLIGALAAGAVAQDRIVFSRVFPGSVPEEFEGSLSEDGRVVYSEPDEESVEFSVGADEAEIRFEQARALDFFGKDLASKRNNIASSGLKMLRYESEGTVKGEAKFDYSDEPVARELAAWFIMIAETEQHLFELERVVRFDRLGINQALINLEYSFNRDRVVAAEQLVPILTKINAQKNVVHLARARAAGLLERIEARKR